MKLFSLKKLLLAATVVPAIALLLTSCRDEEKNPGIIDPEPEAHRYISIRLHASQPGGGRADGDMLWGNIDNPLQGSNFENAIDPNRLHVALYSGDGSKLLTELSTTGNSNDVMIQTLSEADGLYYIYFDITGLDLKDGTDYIAAVSANFDGQLAATMLDRATFSLTTLTGSQPGTGAEYYSKNGHMPMFGFVKWTMGAFHFPEDHPGFPSIGTIEMLRSVCKIEVTIGDTSEYPKAQYMSFDEENPPRLGYVSGTHLNRTGNLTVWSRNWLNGSKRGTGELSVDESFYENTSARWTATNSAVPHMFLPGRSEDGRTFFIYLPEASGAGMHPNEDPLRLNVSIKYQEPDMEDPKLITGTLFPSLPYDETDQRYPADTDYDAWRLCRNHIYRFILTDFVDETALKYKVSTTHKQIINVPDFD